MLGVGIFLVFFGAFVLRHNILVSIWNGKSEEPKRLITGLDSLFLASGFGILLSDGLPLVLLIVLLIFLGIAPPCLHYAAYDFTKKQHGLQE